MAIPGADTISVPLSLFSSLDTELSAPDLPEGISPDNSDIAYLPGSVFTRPGYSRVFVSALLASATVTYEKSFVTPSKDVKNLYLTNTGLLYVEDVTNAPGVAALIYTAAAGVTAASSVTAFGREYIALSDGVHGADIPLQYDGTNLYRVTQDGPGAPPAVQSVALPSATLQVSGVIAGVTVTSAETSGAVVWGPPWAPFTIYTTITVVCVSVTGLQVGQQVALAGTTNTPLNSAVGNITAISGLTVFIGLTSGAFASPETGTGGTLTPTTGVTLIRQNNVVSGATATPHNLQVGFQAQIQDVPATAVGGGIVSIVLNNENQAGIATVTTNDPHGLLPNNVVSIAGVTPTAVGGGISNIELSGDVVVVTTASAHGLQIGSVVNVAPVTNTKLAGQWYVTTVPSTTTFTYAFIDTDIASGADTGTVNYVWPLANANPELNFFTVQTAATATTFTIALSYTDGSWSGGTITFAWEGNFYVTATPTSTAFSYQQYGPNSSTTAAGTVTPYGQVTPGIHQCQVCFLLASGAITAPSPPVTFAANGGQYLSVTNIPVGGNSSTSAAVVGRILLFTGSGGAYFFYIPVPAQVNGLAVSTATQINDNTSTSVLLDFADATLYAATACSVPGNNLAAQVVLGPCAGFFTYASRLQAWGERNKVQNLLNMSFDGGYVPAFGNTGFFHPCGWTPLNQAAFVGSGQMASKSALEFVVGASDSATLSQGAYEDCYGSPILLPNTTYTMRFAARGVIASTTTITFSITSASTGFSSSCSIAGASLGAAWSTYVLSFSLPTPATIPADMEFSVSAVWTLGTQIYLNEFELIYTNQPYLDTQERLSYEGNPEGFDGLTGVLGPEDDLTPIMNHGVIRNTLYIVTGNGLHETHDNGSTEPSGWDVEEVDDECGAWSISSVARNPQGIGSGGKGFMAWIGPDGAQVFTGRNPEKVSQEIQSLTDAMDQALASQCWAKNDQSVKRCYFGIPLTSSKMQVLALDYRNLATEQIGSLPPVHISFTGKMIASDLTRKWTMWNGGNFYCGELMYHPGNAQPVMTFGGVNPSGGANVYTLDPTKHSDDDFGVIPAYYTTYFFVGHEMEQALQVGSHLKQYEYIAAYLQSVGTIAFTPYLCSLTNPQAATPNVTTGLNPEFDYEMGLNILTSRCAFKIAATPLLGQTDSYFNLQKLIIDMKKAPVPLRGSNQGSY